MRLIDFNKKNNPNKHCIAYYVNGFNQMVYGVILDGIQRTTNNKPYVCVDSYSNKISLRRIVKVEETEKDW